MPLASAAPRNIIRSSSVVPSRVTTTYKSTSPPSPHTAVGLDILAELRHLRDSIHTTTSSAAVPSSLSANAPQATAQQRLKSTIRGRSGSVTISNKREGGSVSFGNGITQHVLPNQRQVQPQNLSTTSRSKIKPSSDDTCTNISNGKPPLVPGIGSESSISAGDGLLSANVGIQPDVSAIKRELHRVTESYGALVREYRAAKVSWEAEDTRKNDEILRLTAGLTGADRSRRDVYEALKTAKESRLEAQREREACVLHKEKAETEKKLRESAERRATDSAEQLKTLHLRLKDLGAMNEELEISRTRESAAIKRVRDSDEKIKSLLKERDDLTVELNEQKRLLKEGSENFTRAKSFASMRESLESEARDARDRLASMAIRLAEVEESASRVPSLTEERDDAKRNIEHLESVQSELLTAVQLQASDLSRLKEEIEGHAGDAKRINRLEKALEAYRNVEKLFTQRTGQGFFGPAGLASAAANSYENEKENGSTNTSFSSGNVASELVGEYIERLRQSITAEVKAELSATISIERQKAAASVLEAEMRMLEHQKAADAACTAREVLEAWKRRALAVEETVSSIISAPKLIQYSSTSSSSSDSEGGNGKGKVNENGNDDLLENKKDPLDPDISSDPLYTSEWDKLPSFVAVLPRLASAVGRLRMDIGAAIRRRRLAEIEAQDLREELACVRGDDIAAVALHRVASNDVRNTLKRASDERSNLRAEISSLTAQLSAANIRISDLEAKLVQAGSKLNTARQQRDEKEKDVISLRELLEIEKATCTNAKASLAIVEQRLRDAKETNERALKMLATRDAEITRIKVFGGETPSISNELEYQGQERGNSTTNHQTRKLPTPSLYGSLSVPNYTASSVFSASLAAKAAANEAAILQQKKEKVREKEEQDRIGKKEKERKTVAKATRAKAEAAAMAASAQAIAAEAEERRRHAEAEAAAAASVTAVEQARAVEAKKAAKEARRRMREAETAAIEADAIRRRELEAVSEQIKVMEMRRNEEKKEIEKRAAVVAQQAIENAERLAAYQQSAQLKFLEQQKQHLEQQQQQHERVLSQQTQSVNHQQQQTQAAILLMQQAAINSSLLRRGSRDSELLELSLHRRGSESSTNRAVKSKRHEEQTVDVDGDGRNRRSRRHRHREDEIKAQISTSDESEKSKQQHDHQSSKSSKQQTGQSSSIENRNRDVHYKTETKLEDAISSAVGRSEERGGREGGGGGEEQKSLSNREHERGSSFLTSKKMTSIPDRTMQNLSNERQQQQQQQQVLQPSRSFPSSSQVAGSKLSTSTPSMSTISKKSLAPAPALVPTIASSTTRHNSSSTLQSMKPSVIVKGISQIPPAGTADTSFSISTPSNEEEDNDEYNDDFVHDDAEIQPKSYYKDDSKVPEWKSASSPLPSVQNRSSLHAQNITTTRQTNTVFDSHPTSSMDETNNDIESADTTAIFAGITDIYLSSSRDHNKLNSSNVREDEEREVREGDGEQRGRRVRRESIRGLLSAQEIADAHFKTTLRSREGSVASSRSRASSRASSTRSRSSSIVNSFSRTFYHKK
jgi:hypothetical protein